MKKFLFYFFFIFIFSIFGLYFYLVYELVSPHATIAKYGESNYYLRVVSTGNKINFIFYPGAFVSAKAYLPLATCLSQNGVNVYIAKMPLYFALLDVTAANRIIRSFSGSFYGKIAIGGHSLGGVAAAKYINYYTGANKLILLGSYPAQSLTGFKTLSIIGGKDGLATFDKIMSKSGLLDKTLTTYIYLTGANHSQFGRYGSQRGDNVADISPDQQLIYICDNISTRLKNNQ